ncbi:hypothetical protein [Muribaculum caecicola]|uniref:Uncharacterized protein n=1 Tax=Muribaculum caecicola TaxID=3038144 RepID=A0AC61S8L6_9BACT|nr:hypothetical protein [Muribaculum caecicola]THG55400.1 hypothetical protein E5990_00105 [Muribaculum caecicola]
MHKLYTFIALLTLLQSTSIHAQELTVTNFQETINQMTVDMQQRDFNNEICAIVMVENANGLKPTKVIALPVQKATPYSYQQTEL